MRLSFATRPGRRTCISPLVLEAKQDSDLILIDVPSCKGWGYSRDPLKGRKSG
jgi:hypothetical protein